MECIIIDDELTARVITARLCAQESDLDVVEQFNDAIDAIKYLNNKSVDLIFLDIHMPTFNGIDFVQTLKFKTPIICITSDRDFAVDAFQYDNIVGYLLKPLDRNKFAKAVEKVRQLTNSPTAASEQISSSEPSASASNTTHDTHLYVNIDRRLVKIEFDTIYVIEAKGDYILIKTEEKNYTVHSTLKKIEDKLPKDRFLKVHRSYIIHLLKIVDIEDNSVLIKRDVIPVSRTNKPILMQRLNLL